MKISILLAFAFAATSAWAAGVEKWTGTGATYSPDGKILRGFTLQVENTELAAGVIQSETKLLFEDGVTKEISQTITLSERGWSTNSSLGKGGGTCYGEDICENYLSGENGFAYATTIIKDGTKERRDVTFVLQNGKAIQVLRSKLTRIL